MSTACDCTFFYAKNWLSPDGGFFAAMSSMDSITRISDMRTKLLPIGLAALTILTACTKAPQATTEKSGLAVDAKTPAKVSANAAVDAEAGVAGVTLDNLVLQQRTSADGTGKDWVVRANLINGTANALAGGDFVLDLTRKGESVPFARHGTQIFFSPNVVPGRSTAFLASFPEGEAKDVPPVDGIQVNVKMTSLKQPQKVADGWKPLDPATVQPKVVSDTVVMSKEGKVLGKIQAPEASAQVAATAPPAGPDQAPAALAASK